MPTILLEWESLNASMFTARCYAERGYEIVCRLSLCLSVMFRYRDHIGWKSSKTISRPNSLRLIDPNMGDLMQREHPQN